MKKTLIIVSTGRCGTKRLYEIFSENLNSDEYKVNHQVKYARIANVLGNIILILPFLNFLKKWLYNNFFTKLSKGKNYVTTDPLVSLIIPKSKIHSKDVSIVHIYRDSEELAKSFFRLTRTRKFSFIAHNFIPFWQPYLLPLENWIRGDKVKKKYKKIAAFKYHYFSDKYSKNPNYIEINMKEVFNSPVLVKHMEKFFAIELNIPNEAFSVKSNQSG